MDAVKSARKRHRVLHLVKAAFVRKPTEKPQELKDVLKNLAESSSLHGVPKLLASPQIAVKILWSLLFLVTFGLLCFQIYTLFSTYTSKPIDTSVSLKFSQQRFPAITVCNMNPVTLSNKDLVLKTTKRKKRDVDGVHGRFTNIIEGYFTENKFLAEHVDKSLEESIVPTLKQQEQLNDNNVMMMQLSEPPNQVEFINDLDELEKRLLDRVPRAAGSSSTTSPSSSPSSSSSSDNYTSSSWDTSAMFFSSAVYDIYDDIDIRRIFSGTPNAWEMARRQFQYKFKSMPIENRVSIGHDIQDMLLSLTFLGFDRNVSHFQRLLTSEYGNCYTLDDELFVAWRGGPANGLSFTMNLMIDEYINQFSSGYGVRIVFHEPGTLPSPGAEGITLSPGTDNSIALKMVRLSRLGEPYGDCTDGKAFYESYGYAYSPSACMQICRTNVVISKCGCLPLDAPELPTYQSSHVGVCNMTDMTGITFCMSRGKRNGSYRIANSVDPDQPPCLLRDPIRVYTVCQSDSILIATDTNSVDSDQTRCHGRSGWPFAVRKIRPIFQ